MKLLWMLAMVLVVGGSSVALAGPKETAARAEYEEGTAAYNLGHFDEAAQRYEAAYKLVREPNFLFNIAQSYRMAGKLEQALPVFRGFLRESPTDAPNRRLAQKLVDDLKRKIEENKTAPATIPPAAKEPAVEPPPPPAVSAPPTSPTPLPPPVAPAPSPEPATSPMPLPVALPAAAAASPNLLGQATPPEQPSAGLPFYKTWWFWTGVGGVVVAGAVTAIILATRSGGACDGASLACMGVK
jgi:tetratricopeptide (TPR) repeat protein